MSGIADVARRAGVSKATASRALTGHGYVSPDTRARVQDAARALGYVASSNAASLVTGRTRTVGVIMPYLNRWFFAEVLQGIQDALLEHGLDLTLYDARPGSRGRGLIFEDFLARKRFDGLIAVGRPFVSVVGDGADSSSIHLDDDNTARRATDHLLALGHRRVAFVGGDVGSHWADVDRRRLQGYEQAMTDAGLGHEIVHVPSDVTLPGGYAAAVDVLSDASRRPTGLVGVCDEVAIGAIIAARRLGIQVPGDLSVVGIDDHELAEMFALTTLAQDPRTQGVEAVRVLLEHIADPEAAVVELRLQARLIVRSSTAPVDRASSAIEANTGRR